MTQAKWLKCVDPAGLEQLVGAKASQRKARLYACACCRALWARLKKPRSRKAVETAEEYADGNATKKALRAALNGANEALTDFQPDVYTIASVAAEETVRLNGLIGSCLGGYVEDEADLKRYGEIVRDIFGNPFRPVKFLPKWRTEHAVGIATKMYEERDFAAMPILADALEEAGCSRQSILDHCREPGLHFRGCWVVDLILDKE